jgi:hypothetical protein
MMQRASSRRCGLAAWGLMSIEATVSKQGAITVTNDRTGFSETY